MLTLGNLKTRTHGRKGKMTIVLHGGPGAAGHARMLAEGLSDNFTVIEPWQRSSQTDEPLTVDRHIDDLHSVVKSLHTEFCPPIVGESWGAMLALAYGAEHPHNLGPMVLVGCGTFSPHCREVALRTRETRISAHIAKHPQHAADLALNRNDRILKWHHITDNFAPLPRAMPPEVDSFDLKAHIETWQDMLTCQENGLYPQAFSAIKVPVIMLHGAYDPHPGRLIRDTLKRYIPQLEYVEFEKCGHNPVIEKNAREKFFSVLQSWLREKSQQDM